MKQDETKSTGLAGEIKIKNALVMQIMTKQNETGSTPLAGEIDPSRWRNRPLSLESLNSIAALNQCYRTMKHA